MVQPAVKVINLSITDQGLEPKQLFAPGNEPIRFVVQNRTARKYQFAIPSGNYRINDILPGETKEATFTFVNVGHFEVFCRPPEGSEPTFRGDLDVQVLY